jgi:hypothetical protein
MRLVFRIRLVSNRRCASGLSLLPILQRLNLAPGAQSNVPFSPGIGPARRPMENA